jgi:hypothetical protein
LVVGSAKYVGRVGALAVALGIGTAVVTTPGIAWADGTGASSNDGPSQETSGTGATGDSGAQTATAGNDATGSNQDTADQKSTTTSTVTTTQGSTTTTVSGGGSTPTVTFGSSSNTGSIGSTHEDVPPSVPSTAATAEVVAGTVSPSAVEATTAASTPKSPEAAPTATVEATLANVAATSPNGSVAEQATTNLPALTAIPSANANAGDPMGQVTGGLLAARFTVPTGTDTMTGTNSTLEANTFSALVAPTLPVPTVPPPTLADTVLALPGAIISTVLNVITQALAPLIGPGAPADNPVLWGVLAFVRRQFNETFANSTPVLAPRQTSQDLDDSQVHGTFGATDADGDTLSYTVPTIGGGVPIHGTVAIDEATGTYTYTPTAGYVGEDYFFVTATDGAPGSHIHALGQTHAAAARVDVTVAPSTDTNHAPTAANGSITATEDTAYNGALPTGSDVDGDTLTYAIKTNPTHGTITNFNAAAGSYTYTPAANYDGPDSFSYTAADTALTSAPATVNINVRSVDDAPVITSIATGVINQGTGAVTYTVTVADVDTPDSALEVHVTPPAGDAGTISPTARTAPGTYTFTYTPDPQDRLNAWTSASVSTVGIVIGVADSTNPVVTVTVSVPVVAAAHFEAANIVGSEQQSWGNQGLAVGPDGRYYATTYLVDNTAGEVVVLNADGQYSHTIDIAAVVPYSFVSAYDVAIGPNGKVYVSGEVADTLDALQQETGRGIIVMIDPGNADAATVFADTADPLSAIAVGADGRVYAANWNSDTIRVFNADGSLYQTIDTEPLAEEDDSGVAGLALGPGGRLYLTKPQLGVLKVVNTTDGTTSIIDVGGQPWSVAVGANGVAYVTSFNDPTVALIDPTGTVFHTFDLGPGASPSDVTIAADGRIHVAYLTANGGAIAIISPVTATSDTTTAVGPVLSGVPAGPPLVAEDVVYQAVSGIDAASGNPVVTVAATTTAGGTTLVQVPGEQVGAPILGPNDVLYQTVRHYDVATDTYQTGVLRVASNGTTAFTGLFTGVPSGAVVFDHDDNAYQIVTGADSTTVLALSSTGTTATYTVPGLPDFFVAADGDQPTATLNGIVYLTTIEALDGTEGPTTNLTALSATSGATFTFAGVTSGPPAATAAGTVVVTIARPTVDPGSGITTFTTVVVALTDSGLVQLADTVPGLPMGSAVAASDGTLYQTVVNFDIDVDGATSAAYTSVTAIGETGLTPVFERMPGIPVDGNGALIPLVAGANGIVYQTTYGYLDPSTGGPVTLVAVLSSAGIVYGGMAQGQPTGAAVVGTDGAAYQTTYDATSDTTRIAVVTPTSVVIKTFAGAASSSAVAPDGTFYQIVVTQDPFDGADITTVVVVSGADAMSSSYSGSPTSTVVFDSAGAAYLTVSAADFASQSSYTQVLSINGDSLTPFGAAIRGNPAGSVVIGPDGAIYQAVLDADGVGSFTTTVHVVEPLMSMARSAIAASSVSGTTYVIDDAYLAPFLAADPNLRFAYTRSIVASKGAVVDFPPPMSDAELVNYVKKYVDSTGVTSAGFARDSQGRITFHNSSNTDMLVLYGAQPDRSAQGALLARPGATVVLSAGPEGRVAAAYTLASSGAPASVAYRGATPIPTTAPKTNAVLTSTSSTSAIVKTEGLINRIEKMPTDTASVDIIKSGDTHRMVVYLSGMNGGKDLGIIGSLSQAFQVRYLGLVPGYVSSAIDDAMKVYPNVSEIMLVGHSAGGMIAQNYVKYGKYSYKVTVVVASAAPVISVPDNRINVIFLRDPFDTTVNSATDGNSLSSNDGKGRVYNTPPTPNSGKHEFGNYKEIARNFDWDSKWTATKKAINNFSGSTVATNPKPPKPNLIWSILSHFA